MNIVEDWMFKLEDRVNKNECIFFVIFWGIYKILINLKKWKIV